MFNNRTWPDFVALSEGEYRLLRLEALEPDRPIEVAGLKITPIPVDHVVPTLGFLVEDGRSAVVIASDTGPTDLLWRRASEAPRSTPSSSRPRSPTPWPASPRCRST